MSYLAFIFCVLVIVGYLCYSSRNHRIVELKKQETIQQSFDLLAKTNDLYIRSNTLLAKIAKGLEDRTEEKNGRDEKNL